MSIITLDMETFYDKDYSLTKMTTESYIRDPRFETIGFSIKVESGMSVWFSGDYDTLKRKLDQFELHKHIVIAHNAAFDCAILNWHFGIKPRFIIDTMSMARPEHGLTTGLSLAKLAAHYELGVKGTEVVAALGMRRSNFSHQQLYEYGQYCCNDVDLTYDAFRRLAVRFPRQELEIIDMMIRMFTEPVLTLDGDVLQSHLDTVIANKERLMATIEVGTAEIMSNDKFAAALESYGVVPPTKISPKTGKLAYAFAKTDSDFKDLLEHEDERVQALVAARLGLKSTLEETRTQAFLGIKERGTLPIMLNYYGAHTGRASGGDKVNLQNLPRGGALRNAITAPDGHMLVACDSSQIEARMVGWAAGQDDLTAAFAAGEDIYSLFASDVYGRKIVKGVDTIERHVGKTCLAEGTPVLCERGWVPIEQVTTSDRVWDGVEWVCHAGLVMNGWKQTLPLCGIWLTPDHLVWSGTQWLEAQSVVDDERNLSLALATAAENLPSLGISREYEAGSKRLLCSVIAERLNTPLTCITSAISKALGAICALKRRLVKNGIGFTQQRCPTTSTALDYLTDWHLPYPVAPTQVTRLTSTTVAGVYTYASSGAKIEQNSYATCKRLTGGITRSLRWIGSTLTGGMSREISGLSRVAITSETSERSKRLRKRLRVYDLASCGPRHRFTVKTERGPLIVHNCILGLGYGMSAAKFKISLKNGKPSVDLPDDECQGIVALYRRKYAKIKAFWKDCHNAMLGMYEGRRVELIDGLVYTDGNTIVLPNGMRLRYTDLNTENGKDFVYFQRKKPVHVYGAKITENLIQALARIVVFDQMRAISKRYKVVLTVHDECCIVVPETEVEEAMAFMTEQMSIAPQWATGLPITCEAGYGKTYGECK